MANYGTHDIFGDPRSSGWEDQNLVTVRAPNGQAWRVHKLAAPAFQGLFNDLSAAGYNPMSSGGFNYRTIRGSDKLSQHAFGNAIDINAATNPMAGTLQTDMPANIGELAAKYGLEWGGNWKNRPDPMHFEWKGPAGGGGQAPSLPAMFTGAAPGSTQMAGATPGGDVFGQVATAFLQDRAQRQQQQAQQQQADQERRQALFGGVSSLYG